MKTTEENDNTLVIIDQENMKHLSLPTQKLIGELSEELDIKKLTVFNPLVETMIKIEGYATIKYNPEDDSTIDSFKEAKSTIRSFNASTKKSKSFLKKPILETGKKLDRIEKVFLDRAKEVLDKIESEFKVYLDEQEKIKEEKLAKKNAATTEKIKELSDEGVQAKLVIERMNLNNKLTKEVNGFVGEAVEKAKTFSKNSLLSEIEELKEMKENGFSFDEGEKNILLEEQMEDIINSFQSNIDSAIHILQSAYDKPDQSPALNGVSLQPLKQMEVQSEEVDNGVEMMAPSLTQTNPGFFKDAMCDIVADAIQSIDNLNPANQKEEQVQKVSIISLESLQTKIIDFLS